MENVKDVPVGLSQKAWVNLFARMTNKWGEDKARKAMDDACKGGQIRLALLNKLLEEVDKLEVKTAHTSNEEVEETGNNQKSLDSVFDDLAFYDSEKEEEATLYDPRKEELQQAASASTTAIIPPKKKAKFTKK
jgi:hypothetical protein